MSLQRAGPTNLSQPPADNAQARPRSPPARSPRSHRPLQAKPRTPKWVDNAWQLTGPADRGLVDEPTATTTPAKVSARPRSPQAPGPRTFPPREPATNPRRACPRRSRHRCQPRPISPSAPDGGLVEPDLRKRFSPSGSFAAACETNSSVLPRIPFQANALSTATSSPHPLPIQHNRGTIRLGTPPNSANDEH